MCETLGEWGAGPPTEWNDADRDRAPTEFEKENPNILMLDKDGQFLNMWMQRELCDAYVRKTRLVWTFQYSELHDCDEARSFRMTFSVHQDCFHFTNRHMEMHSDNLD